jgi:hypothetical protein
MVTEHSKTSRSHLVDRFIYCNTFVQCGCGFICHKFFVKVKIYGIAPIFIPHSRTSERENYFISIHHKKKELQNDPAMLSEIKILIEKGFGLLQVNEGLI